jgi:hypothetical protein
MEAARAKNGDNFARGQRGANPRKCARARFFELHPATRNVGALFAVTLISAIARRMP